MNRGQVWNWYVGVIQSISKSYVETHMREYPSGANTLLTIGISALGPIDKDCASAPETATRGKRKRPS